MIFPDLPKHYTWQHTVPELAENRDPVLAQAQAPLRGSGNLTVDEWLEQRGYSVGPAAGSRENRGIEPIDWFAKDALEFYALCVAMVCWTIYWWGIHHGAW